MCNHVFIYPQDLKVNYCSDGKTLTGICKLCGVQQKSLGYRGAEPIFNNFQVEYPFGEITQQFDKSRIIC